jgi:hypothetical protein
MPLGVSPRTEAASGSGSYNRGRIKDTKDLHRRGATNGGCQMRTRIGVAIISLVCFGGGAFAQAPAPAAGPEHKRLAYFAGTWNMNGKAMDTPMGPGGPIMLKEVCELMDGGFAVVCRGEGKSPMGPVKSVAIMSYDTEKKAYTYTAAESNMPVFTALGHTKGTTWNWRAESMMGAQKVITRVTITEGGPKAYDMLIEVSMDGKTFAPIVQGKATR